MPLECSASYLLPVPAIGNSRMAGARTEDKVYGVLKMYLVHLPSLKAELTICELPEMAVCLSFLNTLNDGDSILCLGSFSACLSSFFGARKMFLMSNLKVSLLQFNSISTYPMLRGHGKQLVSFHFCNNPLTYLQAIPSPLGVFIWTLDWQPFRVVGCCLWPGSCHWFPLCHTGHSFPLQQLSVAASIMCSTDFHLQLQHGWVNMVVID